jgi:hypothetical protein
MTDQHDIDARLRTLLGAKADEVEPLLSGPELRRLAGTRTSGVPRIAAAVSAAAAVVVVAVATQHLGGSPSPQRGPAGHLNPSPSRSAPSRPAPQPTPVHSPRIPETSPSPSGTATPAASMPRLSTTPITVRSSTAATPPTTSVGTISAPTVP